MSFLYKALLKEQQKTQPKAHQADVSSAPQESLASTKPKESYNGWQTGAIYADDVYSEQPSVHRVNGGWSVGAWLVIAILLLVVGGLSGYIVGNVFGLKNDAPVSYVSSSNDVLPSSAQSVLEQEQVTVPTNKDLATEQVTNAQEPDYEFRQGELKEKLTGNLTEKDNTNLASRDRDKGEAFESGLGQDVSLNAEPLRVDEIVPVASVEEVPDELKAAFEQAVADLEASQQDPITQYDQGIQVETDSTLTDINELSNQERAFIPQIFYQMHIFASEPSQRWIKVNDKTLHEGEYLTRNLKLVEIRQDVVVWETTYRRFSQVALQDYR